MVVLFIVLVKCTSKYCASVGYHGFGALSSPLIGSQQSTTANTRSNTYECLEQSDTNNATFIPIIPDTPLRSNSV